MSDSILWIILFGLIVAFFVLKGRGGLSMDEARKLRESGAKVIDVRSPGEFGSGHLPGAVNIPLDVLEAGISQVEPNKDAPLLLHCASGMRSGAGVSKLKKLGYTKAFNLGSYSKAEKALK